MASFIMSTIVLTLNTLPDLVDFVDGSDYPPFAVVEIATNIWFTAEFVARLFSCPSKLRWFSKFGRNFDFIIFGFRFFRKLMNWVDLLAIMPYYMGLVLTLYKNQVIVGM